MEGQRQADLGHAGGQSRERPHLKKQDGMYITNTTKWTQWFKNEHIKLGKLGWEKWEELEGRK